MGFEINLLTELVFSFLFTNTVPKTCFLQLIYHIWGVSIIRIVQRMSNSNRTPLGDSNKRFSAFKQLIHITRKAEASGESKEFKYGVTYSSSRCQNKKNNKTSKSLQISPSVRVASSNNLQTRFCIQRFSSHSTITENLFN